MNDFTELDIVLLDEEMAVIKEMIDSIIAHNFEEVCFFSEFTPPFAKWYTANRKKLADGMSACCGSTKAVFFSDCLPNWVIKVPFFFSEGRERGALETHDYCAREAAVYEDAKKKGVDEYFAPIFYLGTFGNIPFYLQRYVDINEDLNEDTFFSYLSQSADRSGYNSDDEFYAAIEEDLDYMDEEDRLQAIFGDWIGKLVEFVREWSINDLHQGNFGYLFNRPILIDYSGF